MSDLSPLTTLRWIWAHPANRGARTRALARFVRWQLRKRVAGQPAYIRVAGGGELEVPLRSTSASAALYASGWPDYDVMQLARQWLRPGDLAIDVGANVGVWTLALAAWVGDAGRVVALEPDADMRDALVANIARNGFDERVTVRAEVAAERETDVPFAAGRGTRSHIVFGAEHRAAVPISDVVDAVPRLIKVDTEGAESRVFEGAAAWFDVEEPPVWIVEWTRAVTVGSRTRWTLFRWLREREHVVVDYRHDAGELLVFRRWSPVLEQPRQRDVIVCRVDRLERLGTATGARLRG